MTTGWIVPAFDELEDYHADQGHSIALAPIEHFAFAHGEEALADGIGGWAMDNTMDL